MNVEDVDELGLEEGANVHPFLMHLLDSTTNKPQSLYAPTVSGLNIS